MPTKLDLRPVTLEKERARRMLAASRTQPVRLVQQEKLLVMLLDHPAVSASTAGRRAGLSGPSGCTWAKRFNDGGLDDLADATRGGRPPTHAPEGRSRLVSLATQKLSSLELPFER